MPELESVWIRHAGWIEQIDVDNDRDGNLITVVHPRFCIRAVCHPDGRADIQKFNRDGAEVYQGFGCWTSTKVELPTGVQIKIRRSTKIWNIATDRPLILGSTITVYADEDLDEMEYVFRHGLATYSIGMESVELTQ